MDDDQIRALLMGGTAESGESAAPADEAETGDAADEALAVEVIATDEEPDDADPTAAEDGDAEATAPAPPEEDAASPEDALPEPVRAELEALRAAKRQADELQVRLAQQQADAYWEDRWYEIEDRYQEALTRIEADAQKQYDPQGYYKTERDKLEAARTAAINDFWRRREQTYAQFQARQRIPDYAAEVGRYWRLTSEEIDLLPHIAKDPNDFNRVAQLFYQQRQRAAKQTGRRLSGLPGTGAGRAQTVKVKAGTDQHLLAILGGRVAS